MRTEELRSYKRILIARRNELHMHERSTLATDPSIRDPTDLGDVARNSQDTEFAMRLCQSNSHLLRAIDDALERIRHGTYAVCTHCGRPIGRLRLRAVPWTQQCRNCKERRA